MKISSKTSCSAEGKEVLEATALGRHLLFETVRWTQAPSSSSVICKGSSVAVASSKAAHEVSVESSHTGEEGGHFPPLAASPSASTTFVRRVSFTGRRRRLLPPVIMILSLRASAFAAQPLVPGVFC